ncbi:hypothetical protein SALBM311S_05810 [Streptomyces alboniger]
MLIREAVADDWPRIWPFWHRIVAAAETYAWAPDTSEEAARALWMAPAKRVYVVENDDGAVAASAYLTPNYGGPAAGIANAEPGRPRAGWPRLRPRPRRTPPVRRPGSRIPGAWSSTPSSRPTPP